MKKKALAAILSLALLLVLPLPASAAEATEGQTQIYYIFSGLRTAPVASTPSPSSVISYEVNIPATYCSRTDPCLAITASKVDIGAGKLLTVSVDWEKTFDENGFFFLSNTEHPNLKVMCELRRSSIYGDAGEWMPSQDYALADDVTIDDCAVITSLLCKGFRDGEFDELDMAYTNFVSMLSQVPAVIKLLPLHFERGEKQETGEEKQAVTLFEPSSEAVYNAIVPGYVAGLVYGALAESIASEQSARRAAMDAASKNAGEMIENLSLHYNRARQAAITQEITEIVGGAEQ